MGSFTFKSGYNDMVAIYVAGGEEIVSNPNYAVQ